MKEKVDSDWVTFLTTMVPKVKHPKILEHRPIAVTVNSCNIFWTIMREKIESHLEDMYIIYENQYGFTKRGKPENCLYILDYIANRNYTGNNRKKSDLFYAFIDFKKAYDSINRRKLIEVLIKFKINPLIISLIIQMYEGDRATIQLGKMKSTIEVTSGIRQGCSISTLLFKMVTFTIIEELNGKAKKYKKEEFEGNSIWLTDDSTTIAQAV